MEYARLEKIVGDAGLICRGGFHPEPKDGVPVPAETVVLLGNAGPAFWQAVLDSLSGEDKNAANPLDRWTRRTVYKVAADVGGIALFPFDGPPYLPFQQWARRADAVDFSPLGPLIHPDFGLWHAYRAALAFENRIELPERDPRPSPCETCADKVCLSTCPVAAFGRYGYDVRLCTDHLKSAGGLDCMDLGCRARRACPIGHDYIYPPAQARFHMEAFLAAQTGTPAR